jgi:hypothetical protein
MGEDLHGKIVRTFLLRLVLYTILVIASIATLSMLMWVVHTLNIPMSLVVPTAILIFGAAFAVWYLWHETKREVVDKHRKDTRPR